MSFSASVGAWASKSKKRITSVYRLSITYLGEELVRTKPQGGKVPFLTGNLARSLLASTSEMPKTSDTASSGSNVGLVAATIEPNQAVYIGYQAIYARRQNYGFVGADVLGRVYNQPGSYFVEGAIAKWPEIVDRAIKDTKG